MERTMRGIRIGILIAVLFRCAAQAQEILPSATSSVSNSTLSAMQSSKSRHDIIQMVEAALTGDAAIGSASAGVAQALAGSHAAAFEVASIRPNSASKAGGEGSYRSKIEFTADSLTMRNVDLSECIQWAYGVRFYRLSGLKLLKTERYDIFAKAEAPVPLSQLEAMLQDLLAKRFNLTLH